MTNQTPGDPFSFQPKPIHTDHKGRNQEKSTGFAGFLGNRYKF